MAVTGTKSAKEAPLCPGEDTFLKTSADLPAPEYRQLVEGRARSLLGRPLREVSSEDDRRKLENDILKFEKIHKEKDFLPVRFLSRGDERARAVCRISTATSFGTGFLVAPGVLMTNNHVLSSPEEASNSVAQFDFEEGKEIRGGCDSPRPAVYHQRGSGLHDRRLRLRGLGRYQTHSALAEPRNRNTARKSEHHSAPQRQAKGDRDSR